MNGEAFVGVILQASLVAVGLLMAIFGIVLPSIRTILEFRITEYNKLVQDLENKIKDMRESPKNFDYNKINDTIYKIDNYKKPLPFTKYHVFIVTILYVLTVLLCTYWFFATQEGNLSGYLLGVIGVMFAFSTFIFGIIAYHTIKTIFEMIESISEEKFSEMKSIRNNLSNLLNKITEK